jgi:uncharacterized protein YxjI
MHAALQRNMFLVKEHVGVFKAANNYDVVDPQSGQVILHCREEGLGLLHAHPALHSNVKVMDEHDRVVGGFKQKFFSIGGRFAVLDAQDQPVCTLQGNWTGWDFKFVNGGTVLAQVTKKWAGLGKELFTSADNYMLAIADSIRPDDPRRLLLLAAVMSIDMVLKE